MTYSQYWDEDPMLAVSYRIAYQRKLDDQNYIAWLQGAYINQALTVNLSHMTSKNSRAEYPREPYQIFDFRTEEEKLADERKKLMLWLDSLVAGGKKYGKDGRT